MEYYLLLCVCLFSLGATSVNGCQPVACGCKSEISGAAVNLAALDRHLVEMRQPLTLGNSTAQYYLQLCTPLKLTGSCSNSTVCKVDGSVYTSYGNAVRYSVNMATRAVLVVFDNGDPVGETPRQVSVTIYCGHDSDSTRLNTANDTFLDFTIYTSLPCVTVDTAVASPSPAPMPTTSAMPTSAPSGSTPIQPTNTMLSSSSVQSSFTVTLTQSVQPTFTPTSSLPHSSTPTTFPSSQSLASQSTLPPPSSHPPASGSPLPPSPSQPVPPESTSNPVLPSSSSCPPQPVCECDSCTKQLALGLGVAIPSAAVVTLIVTILFCVCCLKAKKGGNYMRLTQPSVSFNEEDRD